MLQCYSRTSADNVGIVRGSIMGSTESAARSPPTRISLQPWEHRNANATVIESFALLLHWYTYIVAPGHPVLCTTRDSHDTDIAPLVSERFDFRSP